MFWCKEVWKSSLQKRSSSPTFSTRFNKSYTFLLFFSPTSAPFLLSPPLLLFPLLLCISLRQMVRGVSPRHTHTGMQTSTHVHTHREMHEIALISWDTIFHITWIYDFNLETAFTVLKKVYNSFVLYSNTNVRSDIRITVYIPTVYLSNVVAICCTHNIYETNSSQHLAYISVWLRPKLSWMWLF
jgi:hypothetical protein